ncbi:hypothetical protein Q8F55_004950 [Vanrija albida]|uniref:Amidohydrolase 3 domain-containing protein n=1 Tax=Vanrija albida TaxID=181172 RepID=A0ABR3Q0K8_9TREE
MSELRQRKKEAAAKVPAYEKAPRPAPRSTRSVHLALSIVILGFFVLYAQRKGINKKGPWTLDNGKRPLPDWYAVCSRDGRKAVYTVPVESGVGAVECVVVGDKYVVDTGSLAKVRRKYGDKATLGGVDGSPAHIKKDGGLRIIYLPEGHSLTPGLTDAHVHIFEYGKSRELPLYGFSTMEETIAAVEAYVKENGLKKGDWLFGMGWDHNAWPVKEYPTAADLDTPTLRGINVALWRVDVHAAWVSPPVLAQMHDLPEEVTGGAIVRDADGNPTGVFVDNAMYEFVVPLMPEMNDERRARYLETTTRDALAVGLVGVHDAMAPPEDIAFYRRMADDGALGLRIYTMLLCPDKFAFCGKDVQRTIGAGDDRWTLRSVKLFGDGALGSRGAALLEEYSDRPGWSGFLLADEGVWAPLIKSFYDDGWQVNVHCIGDKANRVILDAFESAVGDDKDAFRAGRHRIEHAQVYAPGDIQRAADLNLIGSVQPTHCTSDMGYVEDRLGHERAKGAYAWRTYLDAGGRLALGSDFPVESIDPLKGIYAAVTRLTEKGESPHGKDGWFGDQRLTREEALRGFTVDPAYASFSNNTGSLTPGMRFDGVLWDDDLMTVDVGELLDVKVKATIMDGRIVYGEWRV